MKASELRPGQWFKLVDHMERYRAVDGRYLLNHGSRLHFINKHDIISWCSNDLEVTPLAVAGWDDEPSVDDKLESILSQMNGNPDSYRECVGNPRKVLARICANATLRAKRKKLPEWSIVGEWTGHGSGVSAAIYEYYSEDSDAKPVEPAPSTSAPITSTNVLTGEQTQWEFATPELREQFVQEASRPEPFRAGDWVVCVNASDSLDCLTDGDTYRVIDIHECGDVSVKSGLYFHSLRFRRATAAEIAAVQKPKPLQLAEGKYYERRDGEIVGPAERSLGLPWRVGDFYYKDDGTWNGNTPSDFATFLIREVPPPVSERVPEDETIQYAVTSRDADGVWFGQPDSVVPPDPIATVDAWRVSPSRSDGDYEEHFTIDEAREHIQELLDDWEWGDDIAITIENVAVAKPANPDTEPPKPKQYRPFASAVEFAVHRDRWIREKDETGNEQFRSTFSAYHNKAAWLAGASCALDWQEIFDRWQFDNGEPCGVEVK